MEENDLITEDTDLMLQNKDYMFYHLDTEFDIEPFPSFKINESTHLNEIINTVNSDLLESYGIELVYTNDDTIGVRCIDDFFNTLDAVKYIIDNTTDDISKSDAYNLILDVIDGCMYTSKRYLDSNLEDLKNNI